MKNSRSQAVFIASRKQLHRMALIVTLLKKKNWVKMKTIKNELDSTEFSTGAYLGCGNRTIQRDIAALKQEWRSVDGSRVDRTILLRRKDYRVPDPF